jgi:tetratricopeptide (TPR) repeat protein
MRRILWLGLLPWLAVAQSHWIQIRSGPFELYTDAVSKRGRETLGWFDQFRYVLGYAVGNQDLQTARPIRILLFKNAKERAGYPTTPPGASAAIIDGRDRWAILLSADEPIPHEVFRECARLFLENNTGRMPAAIEHGLADVLSTIEVNGTHVTLGRPLPPNERNRDWARMHLFATNPDYYAKLRILLYNLQKGADEDPAYSNAFGKPRAEIEKEVDRHMAGGNFETAAVDGKALSVERDYHDEQPLLAAEVKLALADLLLGEPSRTAYSEMLQQKENLAAAHEGLALLALREGRQDDARQNFAGAIAAGTPSPRSYLEYARIEPDNAKALAALEKALKLNPKLAETYTLMGRRQTDAVKRIQYLEKAASLSPRDAARWEELAKASLDEKAFDKAAQAWRNAEQAADTPEERARMEAARLAIDQQRLDWEEAERQRKAAEQAREIRRLKDKAIAELRATEARANQGKGAPPEKVVKWWDGPKPDGHATGNLTRVDCLGRQQLRLVIEGDDHKLTRLLIPDASSVAILGAGEQKLGCGVQQPRQVVVEYFAKRNAKSATVGEVATIQFP